jgi:tryptophan synthase beta chain
MIALGDFPTYVVACMGAGSNFGGVGLPFLRAAREQRRTVRLLAVEPTACPKLTRGKYAYDINDFSGTTPITKMYTLGSKYIAPPIHAGGLRYHGTSPFLSAMYADKMFDAMAVDEDVALNAGLLFAEMENVLAAPESAHAIAGAITLARQHPHDAEPLVILINISGHGLLDINAYKKYRANELESCWPDDKLLKESLLEVEKFNSQIEASLVKTGGLER